MQQPARQPFRIAATGRWAWIQRRLVGLILIATSILAVGYLAWRTTQPTPASAGEAGIFTLIAGATNILGAFAFSRIGAVSPQHARSSVRRLRTLANILATRYDTMNTTLASGKDRTTIIQAQIMTAEVGAAVLGLTDAINDWNEVHAEALAEVLRDA